MLQRVLRSLGTVKTLILITTFATLSSVVMYLAIGFLFLGEIVPIGIILSVIIPVTIAPIFNYYFLRILHKLDLAEIALRTNEQKYRQLVKYAPAGIYEIDLVNLKFISVNDVMCEYTGYSEEEFLDLNPFDLLTEESRKLFFERLQRSLQGEEIPDAVEYEIRGKNNREYWVLLNTRSEYEDGELTKATVVAYDITERRRAEEALRRQAEELSILLETSKAISSILDLEEVLALIAERMVQVTGVTCCTISRWDRAADTVVTWIDWRRQGSAGSSDQPGTSYLLDDFPATRTVLQSLQPLVVQATDPETEPAEVALMRRQETTSLLMLPLAIGEQAIGLVEIEEEGRARVFTTAEITLCQALADQAAVAIENARLYQAEQERRKISETMRQTSTLLNSTLELDELLGLILEQLGQVIPYDSASVQRLQDEYLEIIACRGFEQSDRLVGVILPLDPEFPNYRVITTKAPLVFEDITQDYPHFQDEADTYGTDHVCSWLGAPLVVKDQVIGMITLDGAEGRAFSAEEAQLAMTFANHAAVAIENARLYERMQQELAERTQAEEALRHSEVKHRLLIEHIPAVTYTAALNQVGATLYASPQIEALLGFSAAEWMADPELWSKQLHPADREQVLAENTHSHKTGKPFRSEYRMLDRNGDVVWIQDQAAIVPDATGRSTFLQGVMVDITERKRVEEQTKSSLKEKEVLLQEIHHRVKNNMQVISSLLSLQSGYIRDIQALEIFQESQNRVRSMALVHEKLYCSQDLAWIDFADYTRELTAYLLNAHQINSQDIRLDVRADEIFLKIDRAVPCGLIINELVSNALKHAFPIGQAGKIWVDLRQEDDQEVVLQISDNGIGFPASLNFQSTDSLGLQLVNALVKQLDGCLELNNNHGTEFRVIFPIP